VIYGTASPSNSCNKGARYLSVDKKSENMAICSSSRLTKIGIKQDQNKKNPQNKSTLLFVLICMWLLQFYKVS